MSFLWTLSKMVPRHMNVTSLTETGRRGHDGAGDWRHSRPTTSFVLPGGTDLSHAVPSIEFPDPPRGTDSVRSRIELPSTIG